MSRKRFLAVVMALCMTLSLLSPGVLATDAAGAAPEELPAGTQTPLSDAHSASGVADEETAVTDSVTEVPDAPESWTPDVSDAETSDVPDAVSGTEQEASLMADDAGEEAEQSSTPLSGSGTADDPYVISTESELLAVGNDLTARYSLANDIKLSAESWTPFNSFSGVFDGKGHSISGLNVSGGNPAGLFGTNTGTIQNLTVDGTVSGESNVGILVGSNTGTIKNCLTSGTVTGTGDNIGGLLGQSCGTVVTSGSTATVTGRNNTGGLIGLNNFNARVTNCYAQGNVTGSSEAGGLIGYNYYYRNGSGSGTPVVRNCYASGHVNGGTGAGLIGANDRGRWYNSYYRAGNSGNSNGWATSITDLQKQSSFYGWDFANIWNIGDGLPYLDIRGEERTFSLDGDGFPDDPYLIRTEEELYAMSVDLIPVTNAQKFYQLANDITITETYWRPIGFYDGFAGTFDGNGHTISGFEVSDHSVAGLFGASSATIRNLTVDGTINGGSNSGILAASNSGTIENCHTSGTVATTWNDAYVGGLVGYSSGTIKSCFSSATVTGSGSNVNVGGLVGNSWGSVVISGSTAVVTGGSGNVGGLIGLNNFNGRVTNCYAQGNVSGSGNVGGLVGYNYYYRNGSGSGTPVVRNCYASGHANGGTGAGLIGANERGRWYNSYYRAGNSGNTNGWKTALADLKKQESFYGWDFDHIWNIDDDLPYLDIRGEERTFSLDGDGFPDDPYLIRTEEELYAMSVDLIPTTNAQKFYQLANDITITETYWRPIGFYDGFAGTFDGNGHTISGFKVSDHGVAGLFGASSATIRNLTVDGTVEGGSNSGILAASNSGTIENCHTSGTVATTWNDAYVGGLVGYSSGTIKSCFSSATVTGSGSNVNVGGLVGNSWGSVVISGSTAVVTGGSGNIGGLIGLNNFNGRVTNCYAQGNVSGSGNVGGLVGYNYYYRNGSGSGTPVVRNCYASGHVNGGTGAGLIGTNERGRWYNSYYRAGNSGNTNGWATTMENLKKLESFYGWDFANIWNIGDGLPYLDIRGEERTFSLDGDGFPDDPYLIRTEEELYAMSVDLIPTTNAQKFYQLANDITITETYWRPIGFYDGFAGTFDGNGHTISGFEVSNHSAAGLFGASSATIRNLTVDGTISGGSNAGILAASNSGTIENCRVNGTVATTWNDAYVGGLVGYSSGTIKDCLVSGTVTASGGNVNVGGLTGNSWGNVVTSGSTATVTGGSGNIGGLIGLNNFNGRVTNCYALGSVSGSGNVGGLVGYNYYYRNGSGSGTPVVQNCYAISGGIGLIATNDRGTVTASYYNGDTSGESDTDKGTPLTTAQLKTVTSYEGWDFSETWAIDASTNDGYPYLQAVSPTISRDVEPSSVTLDKSSLSLAVGGYEILRATVTPAGMGVQWTSSNPNVAEVASNGTVAAKSSGVTVITVTTADNARSATCRVTVMDALTPVSSVALDKTAVTLTEGETTTVTATVSPENATNRRVTWTSSDVSVAESNNGIIIAKKTGTATIIVTTEDGGKLAFCTVTVQAAEREIPVESVSLNKTSLTISANASEALLATVLPDTATNRTVSWSSSNPAVAAVDNGLVTAKSAGTATITVTTTDGEKTASCAVTVTEPVTAVSGVSLDANAITLNDGATRQLVMTITPENATNQAVSWASYNTSVATVSADGTVTAQAPGTTVITVSTLDGNYTAACAVTVTSPEIENIEITPPNRTSFTEGSTLDVTGLSVRVVYKDGSKANVTDYALSGYEATVGSHTITVSFSLDGSSYTASFDVSVTPKEAILTGLSVTQRPTKTAYAKGEELNLSGMEVTAQYSDASKKVVTENCAVTGYNANLTGAQIVTVSYGGASAQFSVTVGEAEAAILPPRMRIAGYPGGKEVSLTHEDPDAVIRYTTNGDAPTASSALYDNTPIRLTERTVLKAIAIKDGKNSSVASGLITVPKTPLPTVSHASGSTLLPGTIVTLKSSESNVTFHYTTDGSEPTLQSTKYGGSILVDRSLTIRAVAVKDGYQISDSVEATYYVQETEAQRNNATIAVGHVESRAGERISNSVSIFTEGESKVTAFRFTIEYDKRTLEYVSLSPVEGQSSARLFASEDRENGTVTVLCNDVSMPSGEVCALNFNALDSAEDGTYELSVLRENIAITTDAAAPLAISFESGSITLKGSHNSQLTGEILYTNQSGENLTSANGLTGTEITANIVIDPPAADDSFDMLLTANVFLAVYDEDGLMCSLSVWEIDLSDLQHLLFMQTVRVPDNIRVSEIKTMILSDEMMPLIAASTL